MILHCLWGEYLQLWMLKDKPSNSTESCKMVVVCSHVLNNLLIEISYKGMSAYKAAVRGIVCTGKVLIDTR